MIDPQPQPQPQRQPYPDFEMSEAGIRSLHQALGKYVHECIEKDLRLAATLRGHQQQIEALTARLDAQTTLPDVPAESTPTPIKAPRARAAEGG